MTAISWEALAPNTRRIFDAVATLPLSSDFYLAGGTALALQVGHRISYDLDFFSTTISLGMVEAYALQYFEDAENDTRELQMLHRVKWPDVKKYCMDGSHLLSKLNAGLEPRK